MKPRIAIARGRILNDVVRLLQTQGLDTSALTASGRSLMRPLGYGIEAIIVRSSDVPIYVRRGACVLGITGYDTLCETSAPFYELLDLGIARCRMSIAGPKNLDFVTDPTRHWRVATKYPRITAAAFEQRGRYYEIVPLSGAMETAPETGIADCIVDLVDTGKTLKAHDLMVYEDILDVSSRLIANPSGYFRERARVQPLLTALAKAVAA